MKRITLAQVKKTVRTDGAIMVGLLPSKVSPNSVWIKPCWVVALSIEDLERTINEFSYYNCTAETGNRVHYYVEE